jgi:rfaE bifunctional protein kinase chain/domain
MLEKFSSVKVLIIGDVMLDRYCWGNATRISPEAPVPVVNLVKTEVTLGGAANVAANVVGLNAQAILIGVIGSDDDANEFPKILADFGIASDCLIRLHDRKTTVKTRIVANNQHVVRVDQESTNPLSESEENQVLDKIYGALHLADIVVISDYAKGLLTDKIVSSVIVSASNQEKPVLIDPKGTDYSKYRGATLLTPNKREAFSATNENRVDFAANSLIDRLNLSALIITEGEDGMSVFEAAKHHKLNALARRVFDVTGAGDTVIATLAVAMASGFSVLESAKLANIAAGIVVERVGTTTVQYETLKKAL